MEVIIIMNINFLTAISICNVFLILGSTFSVFAKVSDEY